MPHVPWSKRYLESAENPAYLMYCTLCQAPLDDFEDREQKEDSSSQPLPDGECYTLWTAHYIAKKCSIRGTGHEPPHLRAVAPL